MKFLNKNTCLEQRITKNFNNKFRISWKANQRDESLDNTLNQFPSNPPSQRYTHGHNPTYSYIAVYKLFPSTKKNYSLSRYSIRTYLKDERETKSSSRQRTGAKRREHLEHVMKLMPWSCHGCGAILILHVVLPLYWNSFTKSSWCNTKCLTYLRWRMHVQPKNGDRTLLEYANLLMSCCRNSTTIRYVNEVPRRCNHLEELYWEWSSIRLVNPEFY